MENIFTDEIIKDSYYKIIKGVLLNGDYVSEKDVISLIRTILECDVNAFDLDKIEYICMKVVNIKNLKDNRNIWYYSFDFSSNKTIIQEAIRLYNEKLESENDFNDELLDETVDSYKPYSR